MLSPLGGCFENMGLIGSILLAGKEKESMRIA